MGRLTAKRCEIDANNVDEVRALEREFLSLWKEDETVTRSLEQNDCLHKWCRVIRDHLVASGVNVTEETVKELVLLKLGNTKEVMGEKVAMRSHKYKQFQSDLSPQEIRAGHIAMDELLTKIEVWAATDLELSLVEDDEVAA